MAAWTTKDIPSQRGKTAIITGATGGLGFEVARMLAEAGAKVILTGRNQQKGADALRHLHAAVPGAEASFEPLDVASLSSIETFAARMSTDLNQIDILINNAGVMALPKRETTPDGWERQFGTNHLGHFALTGRLLPLLVAGKARVVSVSSIAARTGAMDFSDLNAERSYRPWKAYGQSKLANLLFARDLDRRSKAAGWNVVSVAAHPGVARTELISNGPGSGTGILASIGGFLSRSFTLLSHSATQGTLPIVRAATEPGLQGFAYFGPNGFYGMRGDPERATPPRQAMDDAAARRLWEASEVLTGVAYSPEGVAA